MISAPAANNARAMSGARPNPCEAFSALTTARSIRKSRRSSGNRAATVSRPVLPTTSPRKRILTSVPAPDDAAFGRDGMEPDVVRLKEHGVHLLHHKGASRLPSSGKSAEPPWPLAYHPPRACLCRWAPDTETKIPTEPAPLGDA